MKTIEITLFKFDELSKEAQQVAIEQYRKSDYEHGDFLHFFKDNCIETLKKRGFEDVELQYSLSYSQGDGLSFSAERYTKIDELLTSVLGTGKEKTAKIILDNLVVKMTGNTGRYCFASKGDIDVYLEQSKSYPNIELKIQKVCKALEDIYIDVCKELENIGYADIEYQSSDEAIIESIEANEYDFTEDGKQYI